MKAILILLFFGFSIQAFPQSCTVAIDSLTSAQIVQLPLKKRLMFDSIIVQRQRLNLLHRLDSLKFDYAFIEETFNHFDAFGYLTEWYFDKNDTVPKFIFEDGKFADSEFYYKRDLLWYSRFGNFRYSLFSLLEKYRKFKPVQSRLYDKKQVWVVGGCIVEYKNRKEFKKLRATEIKSSYQIQTMVDRVAGKVLVSVQTAPQNPRFKTKTKNAGIWNW